MNLLLFLFNEGQILEFPLAITIGLERANYWTINQNPYKVQFKLALHTQKLCGSR
jgi:hypothetical protein